MSEITRIDEIKTLLATNLRSPDRNALEAELASIATQAAGDAKHWESKIPEVTERYKREVAALRAKVAEAQAVFDAAQ